MPKYFCYLIRSESSPKSCYIGFTVNPSRRIRQHNGEIACGARKTSKKRPWKFELIVSGFANNIIALMFEWQFQHPKTSRHAREAESSLTKPRKLVNSLSGHLLTLCLLLSNPLWKQCDLSVSFFEQSTLDIFKATLVRHHFSSGQSIPKAQGNNQFKLINLESLSKIHLSNVSSSSSSISEGIMTIMKEAVLEGMCSICFQYTTTANPNNNHHQHSYDSNRKPFLFFQCRKCNVNIHLVCLAKKERERLTNNPNSLLVPKTSMCYSCHTVYAWTDIVRNCSQVTTVITATSDMKIKCSISEPHCQQPVHDIDEVNNHDDDNDGDDKEEVDDYGMEQEDNQNDSEYD